MADGPRYTNAEQLLALMNALQASSTGLTLEQIQRRFEIGRKTAERRLKAIEHLFPTELESQTYDDRKKYWRLRRTNAGLVRLSAVELAALDTALDLVGREGRPDQAAAIRSLVDKVKVLAAAAALPGVETDAGALLEGEGVAMRPGPSPKIPLDVVARLREALLSLKQVRFDYRGRIRGETRTRRVWPLGFLIGARHYLIAHDPSADDIRMFALSNIARVEVTDEPFDRDPDFDLRGYASRSFGVFQDTPHDVVWRFSPEAAAEAADYLFHPTQVMEPQGDGSLIVRFRAGGLWEMAFHLFQWRGQVEVLEPAVLRETLVEMLERGLAVYRD